MKLNNVVAAGLAIVATGVLAGCDTTSTMAPYSAATPNVLRLQSTLKAKGTTVRVGEFSSAPGVEEPKCRLMGSLDVTAGKPLSEYLQNALQTELLAAQVYDVNSNVVINGKIDELSIATMGSASWTIGILVTSNIDPVGYHVRSTHPFKTSYSAVAACQNATNAFVPSVQDAMGEIVSDAGFAKLVGQQ